MGEKRDAYWVFVGKPEGMRPLRKGRLSWGIILKLVL
jgi:hypothetical protein